MATHVLSFMRYFFSTLLVLATASACTESHDTCDDVAGFRTHVTTEITGIDTVAIGKRDPNTGVLEAVDQTRGSEFSNLEIELAFSWRDEEHRFRAPNTFVTSFVEWLFPTANACSLASVEDDFKAYITNINLFSDSDLNTDLAAGQELNAVFEAKDMMQSSRTLYEAGESGSLQSSKRYTIRPAFFNGVLAANSIEPSTHVLTISITLDDGRSLEVRTPEFLLTGM